MVVIMIWCLTIPSTVAQSSVSITYYLPGTNCTTPANERVGWASTNACLIESSGASCLEKANQCGLLLTCDPSTVNFNYWFSAGTACLRGNGESVVKYATNTCLSSTQALPYKGYESVLVCNP